MTRTVWLITRRELRTRLRSRAFAVGTVVLIVVLVAFLLVQGYVGQRVGHIKVGLTGQATGVQQVLQQEGAQLGITLDTSTVPSVAAGTGAVQAGTLDVLVSGPPAALRVIARGSLDDRLRAALDSVVRQQVVYAALAEAGLRPADVQAEVDAAHAQVTQLTTTDPSHGQRLAIGLVVAFLLYLSLMIFGNLVATGVVEEKSSRVVEMLLATVRPWQLLVGKIIGLGAVGLSQLLIIAAVGIPLSLATGALTVPSVAFGALGAAVLWYLIGFLLYATLFAAAGSLVSRQEDLPVVTTPLMLVTVIALVAEIDLIGQDPTGIAATVLSVLPPFSPVVMPGRMAAGAAPGWQVLLAVLLAAAAIAAVTWLAGRIYRNSILHTGGRIRLRDAFR
ncbi:MAG TPA: ABC transporter permease [Pseudonocardiaceae bacterium]|jgi:ABC-2 type transport system permease protein|nr:ABC transporter permease [Pseudonocardiaceae bacterium]